MHFVICNIRRPWVTPEFCANRNTTNGSEKYNPLNRHPPRTRTLPVFWSRTILVILTVWYDVSIPALARKRVVPGEYQFNRSATRKIGNVGHGKLNEAEAHKMSSFEATDTSLELHFGNNSKSITRNSKNSRQFTIPRIRINLATQATLVWLNHGLEYKA